jgi:hypothetical protein
MTRFFYAGDRVSTADFGPGAVVADWRMPMHGTWGPTRDTVWVLLDCGDNPQPYKSYELAYEIRDEAA